MEKKTVGILAALALLGIVISKNDDTVPTGPYPEPIKPFNPGAHQLSETDTILTEHDMGYGDWSVIDGPKRRTISGF